MSLSTIPEIIAELRAGRMVVLVDEEDRENEGDLVMAAEHVTPEAINFMARHGRGLMCLTLTEARCRLLNLPLMVQLQGNGAAHGTNFTVSIEAADGVTTGISAADRARTVQAAVARNARADDLVQPGHIFPLMAREGGVLIRAGHTEAGCDLAELAGLEPAAVICEILNEDGTMARLADLTRFAAEHGLKVGAIADLIHYRSATESLVERIDEREIDTPWGRFHLVAWRDQPSGEPHLSLTHGTLRADQETLVRVHEPLTVLDLINAGNGTHSWSVARAMGAIAAAPAGVLVMINCAPSGEVLFDQIQRLAAGNGQRGGDLAEGRRKDRGGAGNDLRTYGVGAQILRSLGVRRMRLLSVPRKIPSMVGYGLEITGFQNDTVSDDATATTKRT
jgi:3,4-dihydroxy 2-butanone 4-phosphate synthase/GTP cyclohydrolase II